MPRPVNRGFTITLIALAIVAELALRAAASASPHTVRIVYGTTLAMYSEIEKRLTAAASDIRILALGDSLAMTQFQPDVFAADASLPVSAVFNASYLATTHRSQENLLRHIGLDRLPRLQRVLMFVNPRRLTVEGNADADVFRVAIPDAAGSWRESIRERSLSPILDRSRLYGLSRYLISASWRQVNRPTTWDEVEYLSPQGGVKFDAPPAPSTHTRYPYAWLTAIDEPYVDDLRRVIELFRSRGVSVVLMQSLHHPEGQPFANDAAAATFEARMRSLAEETGSVWVRVPAGDFHPPADAGFLDYGHLNRAGGEAFTHYLRGVLDAAAVPPLE